MSDELHVESFRSWVAGAALATTLVGAPLPARAQAMGRPLDVAVDMLSGTAYKPTLPIKLTTSKPSDVSENAEAWIEFNQNGDASAICVASYSDLYKMLVKRDGNYDVAMRMLVGVIAHEQAHVKLGAGEANAYAAQLTILQQLGASDAEIGMVRQRRDVSVKRQNDALKKAREAAIKAYNDSQKK